MKRCFSIGRRQKKVAADGGIEVRLFPYDEVEAATSNFHPSTFLGRGSHGSVYRADLQNGSLVAAAKIITKTDVSDVNGHRRCPSLSDSNEVEILSAIRSPRLVNLLGYTPDHHRDQLIVVVELMPNGSLQDCLHNNSVPPTYQRRIRYARQMAEAVLALHDLSPPVIHRDIKPSNVLIDDSGNARLGDFGLAVRETGSCYRYPPPAGTMGYIDPEYVFADDVSTKSDVFSFGVVFLELITGRRPIDVDYSPPSLVDWVVPIIAAGNFDDLWDTRIGSPEEKTRTVLIDVVGLALKCVSFPAKERPGMAEVVRKLRAADRRLSRRPAARWSWFLNKLSRRSMIKNGKCPTWQLPCNVTLSRQ